MRPRLTPALIPAVSLVLSAQSGDAVLEAFRKQERPMLVVLPKSAEAAKAGAQWNGLCGQEPLVEQALFPLILNADLPADFARSLLQALRLAEGGWSLILKGTVLASGTSLPTAAELAGHLEQAGVKPLRRQLQDFLRLHPDHLEARAQLISLLRRTAEERTRRALKLAIPRERERMREGGAAPGAPLPERPWKELLPPKEKLLSPEEDVRIWAPMAQELDRFFTTGAWLRVGLAGYDSLPLEAASTLMTNLYRRHRPQLLQALRETPGDANVLGHWVWQSRVLGEPLLPTFESLRPPLETRAWPGTFVLKALVEEARQGQDWSRTRRLLERLWLEAARSQVWTEPRMASQEGSIRAREQAWSTLAKPFLEACLKAGELEAASVVLDVVAQQPERDTFLASAAALAAAAGHRAQAQAWGAWAGPKRNPLPSRLWRETMLFASGASAPKRLGEYQGHDGLRQLLAMRTLTTSPQGGRGDDAAWLGYFGWQAQETRWRVVDQAGKTLAEGVELPDSEGMMAALRQAGRVTPEERLADHLRQQPGDLPALHQRMLLAMRALVVALPSPRAGEPAPLEPPQQALLEAFLAASAEAREGGWWQRPDASMGGVWVHGKEAALEGPLKEEASRWLEAVEAALVQTPSAWGLWEAWGLWMAYAPERPIQPLLDRLVFAPGTRPSRWPPYQAVQALKAQYRRKEAWVPLEALVRPSVEEALQRAEKIKRERPAVTPWLGTEDLFELAEALFKQGRGTDADALLHRWMALGISLQEVHGVLGRMTREGAKELAERWLALVPKLPPRGK